mgnify:CR=1 FL=1
MAPKKFSARMPTDSHKLFVDHVNEFVKKFHDGKSMNANLNMNSVVIAIAIPIYLLQLLFLNRNIIKKSATHHILESSGVCIAGYIDSVK